MSGGEFFLVHPLIVMQAVSHWLLARDPNGHFHAIFHEWPHPAGPHAFSPDGKTWYYAKGGADPSGFCAKAPCAFTNIVPQADGTKLTLRSRERPHVVFDKQGNAIALTNGFCDEQERENCWTGIQLVNTGTAMVH